MPCRTKRLSSHNSLTCRDAKSAAGAADTLPSTLLCSQKRRRCRESLMHRWLQSKVAKGWTRRPCVTVTFGDEKPSGGPSRRRDTCGAAPEHECPPGPACRPGPHRPRCESESSRSVDDAVPAGPTDGAGQDMACPGQSAVTTAIMDTNADDGVPPPDPKVVRLPALATVTGRLPRVRHLSSGTHKSDIGQTQLTAAAFQSGPP